MALACLRWSYRSKGLSRSGSRWRRTMLISPISGCSLRRSTRGLKTSLVFILDALSLSMTLAATLYLSLLATSIQVQSMSGRISLVWWRSERELATILLAESLQSLALVLLLLQHSHLSRREPNG